MSDKKPHAVLIPYPVQGHINPLLQLAKFLHLRGFHITYVNTEYNHKRLLKSRGQNAFDGFTNFNFESIPDGLSPTDGDGDVSQDIYALCKSIRKNFLQPFRELLARLNDSATSGLVRPVSCIVSDISMSFTIQAAEELSIPNVVFSPSNACTFLTGIHLRTFLDKGLIPLKDESYLTNGYLDTKVDCMPGLKNFRLRDLPAFIQITDPNDSMVEFIIEAAGRAHRASAFIFNTSNELEKDVMKVISSTFPNVYAIGPLSSLLSQSPQNHLASLSTNLWKEDNKCLDWLESKEPRSVVYVNFGSRTVMTSEKLLEFAWGLANSKQLFLWIIRPDLVIGGSVVLSSEFVNEISDRGLIAGWCSQEKVLNHPSIGGFLTHCGWNSTTESISTGVPMLC
ncbi:putative 7-deoxyloganetin glucosyltransferase [Medicago truncatula]|uniref:Putative 7-deoxyloganetin glucosyltransferase n=1 Tax=Medicago truncatula TaxID=3880 RepID=A0A396HBW1_MEDTR|nr:7-deoxyloganetin glucosyltransferase [Medicago truncatula]RHN50148.1 putative 7-deoxyloganetin glucosyltransferase [Medicago truncatula]